MKCEKTKLKPCPFCGEKAYVGKERMRQYWSVGCSKCDWHLQSRYVNKILAIMSWNKRIKQ